LYSRLSQRKPDQSRAGQPSGDGGAKRYAAEEEGYGRVGFICCVIAMDCPISTGPFGVLECLSHEIIEKVAICLDLDNLKKLSKVSTAFRSVATSVRFCFSAFFYLHLVLSKFLMPFQQPVWYSKCLALNPKRTTEAAKNWCESTGKSFMDVPFFNLWGILNIDRIKLVHITESEELRIPERYLHDPSDADGFVPKTIGRSRSNYVRFHFVHIAISSSSYSFCAV
jgi:hypothetical protein